MSFSRSCSRDRSAVICAMRWSSSLRRCSARRSSSSSALRSCATRCSTAARMASCSRRPGSLSPSSSRWRSFSEAARVCSARSRVASSRACGIARCSLGGIFPRHIKSGRLELADLGGDLLVLGGLAGLALQAVELGLELRCDVLETGEVLFRRAQLELGLVAARVQAGDAGGLFENEAAGLRLGIDDLGDLPLAHQRRRARAGRDIGEQQLHVAGAHVLAVDAVGRARLAFDAARDLQRVVLIVLGRCAAVVILHGDHDFRHVAGRALGGAGEDDVVHARGAHRLVGAFAHDPAQGFQKIGLAAAIGADHAGEARLDQQIGRFHEGFESR